MCGVGATIIIGLIGLVYRNLLPTVPQTLLFASGVLLLAKSVYHNYSKLPDSQTTAAFRNRTNVDQLITNRQYRVHLIGMPSVPKGTSGQVACLRPPQP